MRSELVLQFMAGLELGRLCLAQWDLLPSPNQEPSRGTFVIATGKMNITVNRSPFEERRRPPGCRYPCNCPERSVTCQHGVTKAKDGCRCCDMCTRQHGEQCDDVYVCDPRRKLVCDHGICRAAQRRLGCVVRGLTFEDNSVFNPDCRHQCSCQNGTIACANLCARELTRPSGQCLNARLIFLTPGDCCREWICDNPNLKMIGIPGCVRQATEWTECSSPCGQGVSWRMSNHNAQCVMRNETRLCIVKTCKSFHTGTADSGANDGHLVDD
ncbi:WNT1-inducible-signaling pathway protein 1-like [Varroa destructor]|uniref:Uncharacterized protein n=1 Tax=Varroa destructor TaxID=109461 RepID=A0A7M7KF35_VARDE|nr:WNT1-inducible-signaling pathway protein 1-like [Varroa destructor]